jgi:hypothetical protein
VGVSSIVRAAWSDRPIFGKGSALCSIARESSKYTLNCLAASGILKLRATSSDANSMGRLADRRYEIAEKKYRAQSRAALERLVEEPIEDVLEIGFFQDQSIFCGLTNERFVWAPWVPNRIEPSYAWVGWVGYGAVISFHVDFRAEGKRPGKDTVMTFSAREANGARVYSYEFEFPSSQPAWDFIQSLAAKLKAAGRMAFDDEPQASSS